MRLYARDFKRKIFSCQYLFEYFSKIFFGERVKALAAIDCVRTRHAPAANKSNFVKIVYYAISIMQLRIKILCKCTLLKFFKLFLKNPVKIGE